MTFGMWNHEKIWHENLTDHPPRLSDVATVPREIEKKSSKKSFSTVLFIHTSDYLHYLTRKQSVIHLPTPPENITTLICELWNFFIWLKVCCVLSDVGGSEKNQLWWVATGMSGKQYHSKCSRWPPSALIHGSSLFATLFTRVVHYAVWKFSPRRNKPALNTSVSIHALLL